MRRLPLTCAIVLTTVTAVVCGAAEHPPARQEPAAPAAQPSDPALHKLVFASEAGLILSPVKQDQTAAFEEVIAKVREVLATSEDPVRKQQAAGWKVYKADEPYQGHALYVFLVEPLVKGADYAIYPLLQENLGETPARELFEKFRDAHAGGQHVLNLARVRAPASAPATP